MANTLPYEEAAEHRENISGWCCKTCRRFWGGDEHMARYCCAKDLPCQCGGRTEPHWVRCQACRDKAGDAKYFAAPEVDWDGETPLCSWADDRYFFDADDLCNWMDEHELTPETVRLELCERAKPREFEMCDFLSDDLPEDCDLDEAEINRVVNEWIIANVQPLWHGCGKRVSEASVRLCTDWDSR